MNNKNYNIARTHEQLMNKHPAQVPMSSSDKVNTLMGLLIATVREN